MKRILYVLQQSILNNEGGWLSADSNINMASGLLRAWIAENDLANTWVDVAIAPLNHFADIKSYDEIFPVHNHIDFVELPMTPNAAMNRLDFRSWQWKNVLEDENYDVIITCVTEWVLPLKTLIRTLNLAKQPKIIAQCFWLDTPGIGEPKQPEEITLQWRQAEGFVLADLAVFTCQSTKDAWIENAKLFFNSWMIDTVLQKSVIWDFGYSDIELMSHKGKWAISDDRVRIGFLNRLSGDGYTNYEVFIQALRLLKADPEYAELFEVVFTNPSQRKSNEWLIENVPNVFLVKEGKSLSRSEYLDLLFNCEVTVHLFTKERYGGCALRESIAAVNYTVVADCHEQGRLVANPKLKVPADNITPENVADALRYAIDMSFSKGDFETLEQAADFRDETRVINYVRCSFESLVGVVIRDINKILEV